MNHHSSAPALWFICVTLCGLFCFPATVLGADFTDLVDAADDFDDLDPETWDPFDFNIEPSFSFRYTTGQITREAPCVPMIDANDSDIIKNNPRLEENRGRCDEPRLIYNKELAYVATESKLDIKLRAGLYKDLELHLNVPYVFVSTRQLGYDDNDPIAEKNVSEANSSVDPASRCANGEAGRCIEREANEVFDRNDNIQQQIDKLDRFNAYRYFDVGQNPEYTRSGFGDPSIGLHWAMFNDRRDDTKATLLLGFDYVMPIVPVAKRDNSAVGRGMHELQFKIASSKKFSWIEPYFGIQYFLPLRAETSPIREIDTNNRGQVFQTPPMRGEITFGTEFVPFEDVAAGQRYGIDLRFTFGYVSEGRDYTPMFDHLAKSSCNNKSLADVLPKYDTNGTLENPDDVACAWVVRQPSNGDPKPIYDLSAAVDDGTIDDTKFYTDGILTAGAYGIFRGRVGFYLQPARNFQLKALFELEHHQEHFLSNARTGRDLDDANEATADETVDLEGPDAAVERNPVYNPAYDSAGERFRVQSLNSYLFMVTAALQF